MSPLGGHIIIYELFQHTSHIEPMLKNVIYQTIIHSFESALGQLYEDKSLTLRTRDLIFFTTDLETVNYYSTIHC